MSNIYIQTAYGSRYEPFSPDPDQIVLKDVAHALSNLCRFTGHPDPYYSVAQHCVLMARELRDQGRDPMTVRAALLHDAHEAFVGDMASPLKRAIREEIRHMLLGLVRSENLDFTGIEIETLVRSTGYDATESKAYEAIAKRFAVPRKLPDYVKEADLRMLITEARQLMYGGMKGDGWPDMYGYDFKIYPWIPERARLEFLQEANRCDVY